MLSKDYRQILKLWIEVILAVLFSFLFWYHLAVWFCEVYDVTKFESVALDLIDHNTMLLGACLMILYFESCYDLFRYTYKLNKILGVKHDK